MPPHRSRCRCTGRRTPRRDHRRTPRSGRHRATAAMRSWSVWPRPGWLTETTRSPRSMTAEVTAVFRCPQRGDGVVDLARIRAVLHGVCPQSFRVIGHRRGDGRCAVHRGTVERRSAQNMVEVVVCQHDMAHLAARNRLGVCADRLGFGQRGAGIDQQRPCAAPHQSDRDVQERKAAARNPIRQRFPREVHCPSVSGCAARYWSSTCGVGSAVYVDGDSKRPRRRRIIL